MKISVMNGWKAAPHQWRRYWMFGWQKNSGWFEFSAFGFVFFFYR